SLGNVPVASQNHLRVSPAYHFKLCRILGLTFWMDKINCCRNVCSQSKEIMCHIMEQGFPTRRRICIMHIWKPVTLRSKCRLDKDSIALIGSIPSRSMRLSRLGPNRRIFCFSIQVKGAKGCLNHSRDVNALRRRIDAKHPPFKMTAEFLKLSSVIDQVCVIVVFVDQG